MTSDVEFWFDFSSPYAYFAAMTVESRLARYNRPVVWRPFLLGAAFKVTGMSPLSQTPLRGDYAKRDWERLAKILGLPFRLPQQHPYRSQATARSYYWIEQHDPTVAISFAKAAFRAHFERNVDLQITENVLDVARPFLAGPAELKELVAWLYSEGAKEKLRSVTSDALSRCVFGSPFFLVDGEPFWGWDRLPLLERWLETGEWRPDFGGPPAMVRTQ